MKVGIRDFQSIEDAQLEAKGLTVIVGPSNHGKSAVLRAVEGLLFNRPGEHVVRKGATATTVAVADLPGLPGLAVWTKGKSTNRYRIDGADYSAVGKDAPAPLQAAGYRDVWVGDADRKKGESIRPQVATQFDPLFLLTRSGAFLADVLGLVSRHTVVATAQDRCASDLRSAKQQAGALTAQRAAVDEKLKALTSQSVMTDSDLDWATEKLRDLEDLQRARTLILRRRAVAGVPPVPPPVTVAAPLAAGQRVVVLQASRPRRAPLLRVMSMAVPGMLAHPAAVGLDAETLVARAKVAAGVRRRRVLAALVRMRPAVMQVGVVTGPVETLRSQMDRRRVALDLVYRTQQAARGAAALVEEAERELAEALHALKVCPTCDRPMDWHLIATLE